MKKITYLFALIVLAFSVTGNAQLKVNSNGQMAIGYNDASFSEALNIRTTLGDGQNEYASIVFKCDTVNSELIVKKKFDHYRALISFALNKYQDDYWNMGIPDSDWGCRGDGFFISNSKTDTAYAFSINRNDEVGIHTSNPYWYYALTVRGDAYSTGQWEGSDINMKENIQNLESSLEKVRQMRGISFNFKPSVFGISSDHNDSTKIIESENDSTQINPIDHKPYSPYLGPRYGVVAQEIKEVAPELVQEMDDGTLAVNYNGFIPLLIEAVKEQQIQIQEQEQPFVNDSIQLAEIENKVIAFEDELTKFEAELDAVRNQCCSGLVQEKSDSIASIADNMEVKIRKVSSKK